MNRIVGVNSNRITGTEAVQNRSSANKVTRGNDQRFARLLQKRLQDASGVKFSAHAMERIEKRRIDMDEMEAQKVGKAVEIAKEKGAKDSLFIGNNYALIVNIPNKTVVTAMDTETMSRNVVTNIDSTVIVK